MQQVYGLLGLAGLWLLSLGPLAHATVMNAVMNGDFSAGLTGWSTEHRATTNLVTSPSPFIDVVGGEATLTTQGIASGIVLITLSQEITLPALATTLSVDVSLARGASDGQVDLNFSDFLQVSYLDAHEEDFDQAFLGLNANGAFDPLTLTPVTLLDVGNNLFRFTTSIAALAGRTGTLFFDLSDQDDGFVSSTRVDNVEILVGTTAVPEPATWLLVGSGCIGLLGRLQPRRRSHTT